MGIVTRSTQVMRLPEVMVRCGVRSNQGHGRYSSLVHITTHTHTHTHTHTLAGQHRIRTGHGTTHGFSSTSRFATHTPHWQCACGPQSQAHALLSIMASTRRYINLYLRRKRKEEKAEVKRLLNHDYQAMSIDNTGHSNPTATRQQRVPVGYVPVGLRLHRPFACEPIIPHICISLGNVSNGHQNHHTP